PCPSHRGETQARRLARRPVPTPVNIRLLLDTGSKRTTLTPGIIRHLAVLAAMEARIATPFATVAATMYWVRLEFPDAGLYPFEHVQVARLVMPPALSQFHGLLRRDLLRRWASFL